MGEVFQSEGRGVVGCVREDNVKSGPLEGHLTADESRAVEAHSVQEETKWERGGRWERRGRWERKVGEKKEREKEGGEEGEDRGWGDTQLLGTASISLIPRCGGELGTRLS